MNTYQNILLVLSAKLHKIVKYFNIGPKFGTRSSIPNSIFKISDYKII